MAQNNPVLTERQAMMLSFLLSKAVQRSPLQAAGALKNARSLLQDLGAVDEDIEAISAYLQGLEKALRDDNNVGYW
jgi:hypothetical protein